MTVQPAPARLKAGVARPGALVTAAYCAQVALRLALSIGRDGPTNFADEFGYLANARVLAGGVPGQLQGTSFYRGGYALLLLPAQWLGSGPHAEYALALATNAFLSALVFPLVLLALTRVFGVGRRPALVAAFVAALYPPLVVTTQFAWAESLLYVLVLAAVLAIGGTVTARTRPAASGWAVVSGLCAGAMATTHGRMTPLAALLVLVLVGLALARPDLRLPVLAGVAAAAASMAAGQALNDWLSLRGSGHLPGSDLRIVLGGLRGADGARNVAALAAGQLWYLLVATFGLLAPGLVSLAARLRPGRGWRAPRSLAAREGGGAAPAAAFVLAGGLGLMVLAGLFLRPATRPDHVVYGRYVEVLVPLVLALGLVRLRAAPGRVLRELGAGAAAGLLAAAAIAGYRHGLVGQSPVNWYSILALPPLAQLPGHIWLLTASLAAAVLGGALVVATRRRPRWAAVGLALVMVVMSVGLRVVLIEARDRAIYGGRPVALAAVPGLAGATEVAYDKAVATPEAFSYQWELPRAHFVLFDSRAGQAPAAAWVFAAPDWPQAAGLGATRVWVQARYGQALWRLPQP